MFSRLGSVAVAAVLLWAVAGCNSGGGSSADAAETQEAFLERCTEETLAANPEATDWAGSVCAEQWTSVVASVPMVEAILAAEPASAAPVDPASAPTLVSNVTWDSTPEGTLAASGDLGDDIDVQVEASPASLNFYWSEVGMPIPYDVVQAFKGRGATLTMIGCLSFGMSEVNSVYRVEAPGHAPFTLGVYARNAPTANASSFYNVSAKLTGEIMTLNELNANGDGFEATCPF